MPTFAGSAVLLLLILITVLIAYRVNHRDRYGKDYNGFHRVGLGNMYVDGEDDDEEEQFSAKKALLQQEYKDFSESSEEEFLVPSRKIKRKR